MKTIDYLVIGSGVGGLITAIHYAQENPDRQVVIVTKNDLIESNSK